MRIIAAISKLLGQVINEARSSDIGISFFLRYVFAKKEIRRRCSIRNIMVAVRIINDSQIEKERWAGIENHVRRIRGRPSDRETPVRTYKRMGYELAKLCEKRKRDRWLISITWRDERSGRKSAGDEEDRSVRRRNSSSSADHEKFLLRDISARDSKIICVQSYEPFDDLVITVKKIWRILKFCSTHNLD